MLDFRHDILPLKNLLFRTALRIVLSREEAEDIVQDTLVKLWERRRELEEKVDNLEAFALTATRRLALDRVEKMDNRHVALDYEQHDRPDETSAATDSHLLSKERHYYIGNLINALPEKQRTVLQLRDIEGKSYKEIADVLSITESDVKVTLFRARNALKEKILQKKSFFL